MHMRELDHFVNRRELRALQSALEEGEELRATVDGSHSGRRGVLAATDCRILFITKGLLRATIEQWEYDAVDGLEVERGVNDSTLTLLAPQPFVVTGARKDGAAAFQEAVRRSMANRTFRLARVVRDGQAPDVEEGSVEDRLRRLERMKERRIITSAEFKVNRRRILEGAGLPTDLSR